MVTCFEIAQYKPNGKKNDSYLTNIFLIIILGSTNCQILPKFWQKDYVLILKYNVLSVLDFHESSKRNASSKMIPKMLLTAWKD